MSLTEQKREVVRLTKRLISFPSAKNNQALFDIVDFCEEYFQDDFVLNRFEQNGKPSLVVTNEPTRNPDILMVGHLDVVEASENMFQPQVEDGKLYGRGAIDMKSMDAVMMVAMKALGNSGLSLGLMLTTDEEVGGFDGVNYLLNDEGYSCRCAFVPDGGDNFAIKNESKGLLHFRLKAKGKEAHGSRPWEGENALDKLIAVYGELRKEFPNPKSKEDWKTSLNLGRLEGGGAPNVVPDSAEMDLDLRYPTECSFSEIKSTTIEIVGQHEGVEMEEIVSGAAFFVASENGYLNKWKESVTEVKGTDVDAHRAPGNADSRFFSANDIPAIMSRPIGSGSHSENEFVEIESLKDFYQVLLNFIDKVNYG